MKRQNTHAGKAESYNIGRPNYPEAFFEYLYAEMGLTKDSIIADIGAGTGKITKGFCERGSKVFAVEPDTSMMGFLKKNLSDFPNCTALENTAENTGIQSGSIDMIFCGNSFHWFDKAKVIPEFKRILKGNESVNVIIASLGTGGTTPKRAFPFDTNKFVNEVFEYTVFEGFEEYLHGSLSASSAPTQGDEGFEEYCNSLRERFEKESISGKAEKTFRLSCMIGNVDDLI